MSRRERETYCLRSKAVLLISIALRKLTLALSTESRNAFCPSVYSVRMLAAIRQAGQILGSRSLIIPTRSSFATKMQLTATFFFRTCTLILFQRFETLRSILILHMHPISNYGCPSTVLAHPWTPTQIQELVPYGAVNRNKVSIRQLPLFYFPSHSLHVSAPTGHPQVRYTIRCLQGLFLLQRIRCTYTTWRMPISVLRPVVPNTCYQT
jgi:hypothetical protein